MANRLLDFWKAAPEDPFDAFFDHGPVLMHSIDAEGRLVKVSRPWADLLGYDRDEMIGRKSTEFLTKASQRYAVEEVLPRFMEEGIVHNVPYDFVTKAGDVIPVLMSASSVFDRDGKFVRSLAIIFDNREAAAARAELEARALKYEDADRAKSQFLAAMSHEIRTPMNAIMGYAQLLKLSDLDERRAAHVDAIVTAGGNLMNLLTDLLDLSQVEAGKMRVDVRDFDLLSMLDQVAEWWHSSARNKGLKLSVTLDQSLPQIVSSDPVRLTQVLNNFLGNAVKFTAAGRISLNVHEVSRSSSASRVRFEVSDTGPGMTSAQIEQLFKPFVQIDTDFGKDRGGWGLGLSICSSIAELMGAEIGVTSKLDRGSTFFFELDLPHAALSETEARALLGKSLGTQDDTSPLRVLLAEDNATNQDMMRAILVEMGHQVTSVANGFEVVEALHNDSFDLVIMDVMMPGLDGMQAAEQIRSTGGQVGRVPIVACSARVTPETQERCRELGMDAFLPKPIDRGELQKIIDKVAENRLGSS